MAHLIDWIGLSIDASTDEIHAEIGRGMRGDLARQRSHHLALARDAWIRCKARGIRMKLNTVVCGPNIQDDMSTLVLELMPERWKIFQVLPVEGQNDGDVDSLLIEKDEFENWLLRHKTSNHEGYNLFLSRMISCADLMLCSMLLGDFTQMNLEDTSMALPFWR